MENLNDLIETKHRLNRALLAENNKPWYYKADNIIALLTFFGISIALYQLIVNQNDMINEIKNQKADLIWLSIQNRKDSLSIEVDSLTAVKKKLDAEIKIRNKEKYEILYEYENFKKTSFQGYVNTRNALAEVSSRVGIPPYDTVIMEVMKDKHFELLNEELRILKYRCGDSVNKIQEFPQLHYELHQRTSLVMENASLKMQINSLNEQIARYSIGD